MSKWPGRGREITAVIILAGLVRLAILWVQTDSLSVDIDAYLEIARNLASGKGFSRDQPPHLTAYRPPLYPLCLSLIFLSGGGPWAIGIWQAGLGCVTAGLACVAGCLLRLRRWSLLAGAAVALDPLLVNYTVLPMTETLCAALVSAWCVLAAMSRSFTAQSVADSSGAARPTAWGWMFLAQGLCLGLLCLCRPAFLAASGIYLLITAIQVFRGGRRATDGFRWSQAIPCIGLMVGLGLTMIPWVVRNLFVLQHPIVSTTHGGYTLLLANNPTFYREVVQQRWGTVWERDSLLQWQSKLETDLVAANVDPADEVRRDRLMSRMAWQTIQAEPDLFLRACVWRGLRFWDLAPWAAARGRARWLVWAVATFYAMITGALCIAAVRMRRREWSYWWRLCLLPITLWLTHLVYWTDLRMRAPVIPVIALFAARACLRTPDDPLADETSSTRDETL